jgi:hypothetical protein
MNYIENCMVAVDNPTLNCVEEKGCRFPGHCKPKDKSMVNKAKEIIAETVKYYEKNSDYK